MGMKLFFKGLVTSKKQKSGRGRNGKICVRRKQGRCSSLYRKINFNLSFNFKDNYKLVRVEYDPNRSSYIGLVYNYKNTVFHYILLPEHLAVNDVLLGSLVHNISLSVLGKGILCRSRGSFAKILQKGVKKKYIRVRLPSGEERLIHHLC